MPRAVISRSISAILACSWLGALGSKRPSFCVLFQLRTESVFFSYSSSGRTNFSTPTALVKLGRAAGGRVSTIWGWLVGLLGSQEGLNGDGDGDGDGAGDSMSQVRLAIQGDEEGLCCPSSPAPLPNVEQWGTWHAQALQDRKPMWSQTCEAARCSCHGP